jgi:carboxyl-terminal processing protease
MWVLVASAAATRYHKNGAQGAEFKHADCVPRRPGRAMNMRRTPYLALIAASLALVVSLSVSGIRVRAASTADDELARGVHSLTAAYALVEKNFADPISAEKAIYEGAIPGMLHTLDPHSSFLNPSEFGDMQRKQHAQYLGVGMLIGAEGGKIVVMEPFLDSPAWKADLRRGDAIANVDGHDTTGLDTAAVADLLRGPKGTQVRITVRREGAGEPLSVTVTRGEIQTSVVDAFWLKPGTAYLNVTSFEAQNVDHDVEAFLQKMGEQSITGMILDLRGNPGGLVTEAVALAGRFLHDGQVVVSHRGRADEEKVFRAKAQPSAQRYPVVVLVDRRSASASEIVSGALQDHDRAWLLGETTFGKGLVQAQFPLSEGAALLLTIAHYYTPSGRLIQRDYSHQSLFDYYSIRSEAQNTEDVKVTDSGRKVYGGGGISPDEKYESPRANAFQRRLMAPATFFHFGSRYFGAPRPHLAEGWVPDDETLGRFADYLRSQQIAFTDAEFAANRDWMRDQIRYELYFRAFDRQIADRAAFHADPEVQRAVESMPKAQALLQQAQRVLARRGAAPR